MPEHAELIREKVWRALRRVARPDSRYHFDFGEYIPDFEGSEQAIARVVALPVYRDARFVFVTPDNGLVLLRKQLLDDGKTIVVSTAGIRRGFYVVEPKDIPKGQTLFAAWLDGLEHFGRPISLAELKGRTAFDLIVTGASAVSMNGVRFGKGHGYFDMEWGMFTDIGVAGETTPLIAVVHDVQLVDDALEPGETDVLMDYITTPTRVVTVNRGPRTMGIKWSRLSGDQIACTPPLQELQAMTAAAVRG